MSALAYHMEPLASRATIEAGSARKLLHALRTLFICAVMLTAFLLPHAYAHGFGINAPSPAHSAVPCPGTPLPC